MNNSDTVDIEEGYVVRSEASCRRRQMTDPTRECWSRGSKSPDGDGLGDGEGGGPRTGEVFGSGYGAGVYFGDSNGDGREL